MIDAITIISGLVILFLGGESLIKGSISVARHMKISQILVSSVIVGFGTSMPEMTVSIDAIFRNTPEIAIGNVIGSNIANILFILGISALISPFYLKVELIKRDVVVMLAATFVLCLFGMLGSLNFIHGICMILLLIAYITYSYFEDKKRSSCNANSQNISSTDSEIEEVKNLNLPISILFCIIGIGLLIAGASLFLTGSISIANRFNISKEVIGLGIVAVGSCLPELSTAIIASYKKHGNIIIAGIVGSNIFNILSIVGVMSLMREITIPDNIVKFDLWVFLGSTLALSFMLLKGLRFNRFVGFGFLATYIVYFYALFSS